MSGQLPLNPGFILTPQQQSLLFAALNSNKPAQQSPHNSALSLPPTTLDQSPHQSMDSGLPADSSLLGYDDYTLNPDSSYDFDANALDSSVLDGQMIGDLPGTAPSSKSDSPASPDLHEKRSRSEDDAEQAISPKRRESGEKIPKKPGRKPLTTEPSSKRKAQNRAAQRAFRERKEKHLKDLETKVEELQKASESANSENEKLKSQVEQLTTELKEYKKRISLLTNNRSLSSGSGFAWGSAAVNNINDVNFQFEFPKFGTLPGPSPTINKQRSLSQKSKDSHLSPRTLDSNSPTNPVDGYGRPGSHSTDASNSLGGLFGTPFTANSLANSISYPAFDPTRNSYGAGTTSSPSASSASQTGPSSSCGTSPEPFTQSPMGFKPVDAMTTIGEEKSSISQLTNTINNTHNVGSNHIGPFDMGNLDWLSTQNNFDPQLFGDYREPQDNILASGIDDSGFFNDAFDIDFLTPYNVPQSVAQPKKDILAEIDAQKLEDPVIQPTKPPANFTGKLLTCHKIWEKLQNCPKVQNQDVDLDMLCKDLKEKAKCTGSGPMVNENDFKAVIKKYVKAECANEALELAKQSEYQSEYQQQQVQP